MEWLNPDRANTISLQLMQEVVGAMDEVEADAEYRVVILTGAGKHFSAGGDVRFFRGTLDLHAAQIQGFFDIPVDNLMAAPTLCNYLKNQDLQGDSIVVVSPGGR